MKTRGSIVGVVVVLAVQGAFASGVLIPKDTSVPPLAIKHQRVDLQIKDGTATAKIEQVFQNSVNRVLEAVYVFPLPESASIVDFAMYINGKRMSGEIVEKQKAKRIYQDIVRRMKDPGLLEQMSGNLFRCSVYPVPANGEQRIEISYSESLQFDAGLYKLVYPLKTGERASRTLEDFTVSAKLSSSLPIKNIYSPSHKVGISRKGEHEAIIGFEEDRSVLDRDFVLYYGVSKKDFGLNLLTHAEDKDGGYFMMMISPTVQPPEERVVSRDITFVFDSSGSMSGDKIKQARKALKYCVHKLNKKDRFNIIRFSTDVEPFREELVNADGANCEAALEFIEGIIARGGTDINGALTRALSMKKSKNRPYVVVFLTDGRPTIGVTEMKEILQNLEKTKRVGSRMFVFGVGHQVNTHLLDRISGDNGGISQYVKPGEDIEVKVSSLQDKMSRPVLADPVVKIEKIDIHETHPKKLDDLFAGNQILLFGRYRGEGHVAIRLTGTIDGKDQEYVYEGSFAAKSVENSFIPRLWATRRVGYLLDEIRLHGEEKELKDEVLQLSKEYGIMTPYTSYLVLEKEQDYKTHGISRRTVPKRQAVPGSGVAGRAADRWAEVASGEEGRRNEISRLRKVLREKPKSRAASEAHVKLEAMGIRIGGGAVPAEAEDKEATVLAVPVFAADGKDMGDVLGAAKPDAATPAPVFYRADARAVRGAMEKQSGAKAITQSEAILRYKTAERPAAAATPVIQHVGKRIFYLVDGVWTDRDYRKGMKEIKVKYADDEYFKLLEEHPELKKFFALGKKVIVCLDEETAIIVEAEE